MAPPRPTRGASRLAIAGALACTACVPRDQTGFEAIGPSHRLDAIVQAADRTDDDSLRGLIQALDSDDPAARLLAIRALQRRTHQTLGYQYDDPPWKRAKAVDSWTDWYSSRQAPGSPVSFARSEGR